MILFLSLWGICKFPLTNVDDISSLAYVSWSEKMEAVAGPKKREVLEQTKIESTQQREEALLVKGF